MGTGARERVLEAVDACSVIVRVRNLRRIELAFGLMWAGEWAATVVLGVIAFHHGGAGAVGAVGVARMVPAAAIAPLAATIADRTRRERVLSSVGVIRAVCLGAAALTLSAGGPVGVVYVALVLATAAQTLFRPAHSALLPALCTTPAELTAANVVRGSLDSLATLVGPLAAALLLQVSGASAVLLAAAMLSALGGGLAQAVSYERPPRLNEIHARPLAQLIEGLRAIAQQGALRQLTGLATIQTFTRGALSVLSVVLAIKLLRTGSAGVGLLTAALGAGAVFGSTAAALLVGRGGLARWFGVGVALWGLPLVAIGLLAHVWSALIMLGVVGIGNALVDVGVFTLLARLADDAVLARVFAGFEGIITLGVALGALAAPVLIHLLGTRGALIAIGLVAPIATLVSWPALAVIDRRIRVRDADVALLQRIQMLRPLPEATIEQLAASLIRTEVPAGASVFEQGDRGDDFYVIEAGTAEVAIDDRRVRTLGAGDGFGEIALIRDCARTASVRAQTALVLGSLRRNAFVTAVTGYSSSAEEADRVIAGHLTRVPAAAPKAGRSRAR